MTTIAKTLIGTSDPATVGQGLHLFPDVMPATNFGWSGGVTLWDKTVSTTLLRISSNSSIALEAGFLGPAYGARLDVEGDFSDTEMNLDVTLDEFIGGMIIGVDARLDVHFETATPWYKKVGHWYSWHWRKVWDDQFNKDFQIDFNLLPFLWDVITAVGGFIPYVKKVIAFIPNGLFDHMVDTKVGIADGGGEISLYPQLSGSLDIVNLIEVLVKTGVETVQPETIPVVETVSTMEKVLKKVKPSFTTGPILGVTFPIHVTMTDLFVNKDDGTGLPNRYVYSDLEFNGTKVTGHNNGGAVPGDAERVGALFQHATGLDLVLGWKTTLSWLKVFNIPFSWQKEVLSDLGFDVTENSTQYVNAVNNVIGATTDSSIEITFVDQFENDQ